jgi:hypothetical protein
MKNKNNENKQENKDKKEVKLPNFKKNNNLKPFLVLIVISL